MKVLKVFDQTGFDFLRYKGKPIFGKVESFFSKCPKEWSRNYFNNLSTLDLWRVDEMQEDFDLAEYTPNYNRIIFAKPEALIHEIVHMSQTDRDKKLIAIGGNYLDCDNLMYENALIEGQTEYVANMIKGTSEVTSYPFEVFCITMLSEIENFLSFFFVNDMDGFLKLFPKRTDILSLMYALDYYMYNGGSLLEDMNIDKMVNAIRDVISSLINIELSIEKDPNKIKLYREKFMDLLNSDRIKNNIGYVYKNYLKYADYVFNKRRIKVKLKENNV